MLSFLNKLMGGSSVSPETVREALSDPNAVVLDVRTQGEWGEGHLDGARHLDVSSAGFDAGLKKLPKDKTYYVYCRSGGRSGMAVAKMQAQGFTAHNVGGIGALAGAGLPVKR